MCNRFRLAVPGLAAALVLGACQEPSTPAARSAGASFSGSGDTECPPNVIITGEIRGNIVARPPGLCTVSKAQVYGNIKALEDAQLLVTQSEVFGSIYGDKADLLQVRESHVGGNIEMVEGGPHPFFTEAAFCGNDLPEGNIKVIKVTGSVLLHACEGTLPNILRKGNMQAEENIIGGNEIFVIEKNQVAQNLQVYKNTGRGLKAVQNNTAKSIQCKENDKPFFGTPNTADKQEDQCA
jgi:hypothetical protein